MPIEFHYVFHNGVYHWNHLAIAYGSVTALLEKGRVSWLGVDSGLYHW